MYLRNIKSEVGVGTGVGVGVSTGAGEDVKMENEEGEEEEGSIEERRNEANCESEEGEIEGVNCCLDKEMDSEDEVRDEERCVEFDGDKGDNDSLTLSKLILLPWVKKRKFDH
jgi:hypothetical protein